MRLLTRFILYTVLGWKIVGNFPKGLKKYLIIAAPHTHWLDFPLGIAVKWAEGAPINFIGKASLFKPPFGFIFRWLGGTPVDRSTSSNKVQAIIDIFNSKEKFILALSPEGTRKKVTKWKTGFYHIAKGANVPIVMSTLNFKQKEVKISKPFYLTDNIDEDFKVIYKYFKGVKGKIPENFNL
jgi:1-acyl-sn-glycerol-3-phosphate acyltransferase